MRMLSNATDAFQSYDYPVSPKKSSRATAIWNSNCQTAPNGWSTHSAGRLRNLRSAEDAEFAAFSGVSSKPSAGRATPTATRSDGRRRTGRSLLLTVKSRVQSPQLGRIFRLLRFYIGEQQRCSGGECTCWSAYLSRSPACRQRQCCRLTACPAPEESSATAAVAAASRHLSFAMYVFSPLMRSAQRASRSALVVSDASFVRCAFVVREFDHALVIRRVHLGVDGFEFLAVVLPEALGDADGVCPVGSLVFVESVPVGAKFALVTIMSPLSVSVNHSPASKSESSRMSQSISVPAHLDHLDATGHAPVFEEVMEEDDAVGEVVLVGVGGRVSHLGNEQCRRVGLFSAERKPVISSSSRP